MLIGSAGADPRPNRQDQFKAAYIFNFVKFVEWPSSDSQDQERLTVCFLGGEGVYEALAAGIDDKRIGQRQLAVRRLSSAATLVQCNAVYLDATIHAEAEIGGLREMPVLTVSDANQFTHKDGMIGLFVDSDRLRFNINVDNAQRCGLRISSSLLQLANSVERNR